MVPMPGMVASHWYLPASALVPSSTSDPLARAACATATPFTPPTEQHKIGEIKNRTSPL